MIRYMVKNIDNQSMTAESSAALYCPNGESREVVAHLAAFWFINLYGQATTMCSIARCTAAMAVTCR